MVKSHRVEDCDDIRNSRCARSKAKDIKPSLTKDCTNNANSEAVESEVKGIGSKRARFITKSKESGRPKLRMDMNSPSLA